MEKIIRVDSLMSNYVLPCLGNCSTLTKSLEGIGEQRFRLVTDRWRIRMLRARIQRSWWVDGLLRGLRGACPECLQYFGLDVLETLKGSLASLEFNPAREWLALYYSLTSMVYSDWNSSLDKGQSGCNIPWDKNINIPHSSIAELLFWFRIFVRVVGQRTLLTGESSVHLF